MSVLLCDSNCELWYTRLKELGVDFISMPYTLDDQEYFYDLGEATDFKFFYDSVRQGKTPITSALNPENYKEIFTKYFEAGQDVLYVSFSHTMSGTFNHLNLALAELKEIYPERKCTVFNTNSISLGAGIQVEQAALLKNGGASDEEVVAFLQKFTNKSAMYFVVDDLMHLKRGGRLSAAAAFAGTLLSLKPVLTVSATGGLEVFKKISGKKKALSFLAERVIDELDGFDHNVYVVDANCPQDGDSLASAIKQAYPNVNIVRQPIGPVIGTHCGPGTVGVIFVAKQRPVALSAE
ncbi:MAG: DegV family protein [Clostridia bacterium]|nr:DegV family protein [Clostridia bacterium]